MNNIQKSVMLTGFIISFIMIIFSASKNNIFAVEYDTFTSDTYGIKFQKPIDWHYEYNNDFKSAISNEDDAYREITNVDDEIKIVERNPGKNDDRYIFVHIYDNVEGQNLQSFTANSFEKELEFYDRSDWITDIMKEPTPDKIGNSLMGMYMIHSKSANEEEGDDEIAKRWTILKGNRGFVFEFSTNTKVFNNSDSAEIRDHFINSIKFR